MLSTSDLESWSAGLVLSVPALSGFVACVNRMQDAPAEMVCVGVGRGGRGLRADGVFQDAMVWVHCRAAADSAAEAASIAVDELLVTAQGPFTVGSTYVAAVQPVGGPPSYLERDVNNWTTYWANYLMEAAR